MRANTRSIGVAVSIVITLSSSGCVVPAQRVEDEMRSWVGRHESEVQLHWGIPTQVLELPDGTGRMLVYRRTTRKVDPAWEAERSLRGIGFVSGAEIRQNQRPGESPYATADRLSEERSARQRALAGPPRYVDVEIVRSFKVDDDGKVVSYQWQGLDR